MQRDAAWLFRWCRLHLHTMQRPPGNVELADVADETDTPGFCAWLTQRMQARGMSQRQLARRAGVHHSTISRLLRGKVPTLSTALALQDVLDPAWGAVPAPNVPDLHPAVLSAMLRRDGLLTNDEIDRLVSAYAGLVAAHARPASDASQVGLRVRATRMR
jgi:transcriptional regulator with XRE-family HTH domain